MEANSRKLNATSPTEFHSFDIGKDGSLRKKKSSVKSICNFFQRFTHQPPYPSQQQEIEKNTIAAGPKRDQKEHSKPVSKSSRNQYNRHTLDFSILTDNNSSKTRSVVFDDNVANSRSFGSIYSTFTSVSSTSNINNSAEPLLNVTQEDQLQKRLWNEDATLCEREDIAQWLGKNDPLRAQVLELYMKNFDFSRQRIDTAFRTLCFKLYFRAESQKLDRILESFAQHYYRCNPTTILHSADIVYAIAYSLLLLNTDLYVSQDSKMMTRQHFVKNTLATVQSLTCPSTSSSESSLSTKNSKDYAFGSIKRRSHLVQQITNYIISPDQKIWLAEIENLLKNIYNSVKANRIDRISDEITTDVRKRKCKSVLVSNGAALLSLHSKNKKLENNSAASFFSNDNKILKQGLVMKKHIKDNNDTKSRNHRNWELCFLILTRTNLTLYRAIPSADNKSKRRQSYFLWYNYTSPSLRAVISQIPEWEADTTQPPILDIKINHSYSNIVPPPGWSNQRPHVFRLETGEGGLYLFECSDMFEVQSWVEKSNSAAAKISKGGLVGAVSNVDYGWGGGEKNARGTIVTWHPPMSCMVNSELELDKQFKEIKTQIQTISQDLDQHRVLKFDDKHRSMQALTNWDKKLHYLLHESMKLRVYQDTLYL